MSSLNAEKALIFRITHIENVPWILKNGLHCQNSDSSDPNYRDIGNPDLIAKRAHRTVPIEPGGTLSDYIPFYFTPYSPMLYNIKTGYGGLKKTPMSDMAILVSSLRKVQELGVQFVFTDRHAYLAAAEFFNDVDQLCRIDWDILQKRDFRRDPNDFGKIERYQAEALVHQYLPVDALIGIVCHGNPQQESIKALLEGLTIDVAVKPGWYF